MGSGNLPGESNAWMVRTPCIVFFVLTPIFVALRLWSRIARRTGLGWDDWTIMLSFACALTVQILMMISCNYGFGQHVKNLALENKLMALKLFYIAQIFYKFTINLTKCSPIEGAWNKTIGPKCINLTKNWYANAGFSIATDILILLLPLQPLWASKLPVVQKWSLMIVFTLGGFVTVTSIMRSKTLSFSTTSPDTTSDDITSTLWTMVEENVAIICACLPMCRMPLAFLFPAVFASKAATSHNHGSTERSRDPINNWKPYAGRERTMVFLSVWPYIQGTVQVRSTS
ncbi:hypothetical protein G7Z17_g9410 [Cylindrodendrum hubeiense]|uniref:Rhodopsin domain-containing protein n=1 Tax=Cylindrodendrum hubeiense TaxID=595255 RepID=A0A9P5L860_9HYPO|nr:hypothetical protein G7Z17_g9410 [Cylindrodendrum hubeiense]